VAFAGFGAAALATCASGAGTDGFGSTTTGLGFSLSRSVRRATLRTASGWLLSLAAWRSTSTEPMRTKPRATSAFTTGSGSWTNAADKAPAARWPAQMATRRTLAARTAGGAGGCMSISAVVKATGEQSSPAD
jgi:hypothetical protein